MNILFIHSNGIVPQAGGISRTTYNLTHLFRKKGHNVWLVGAKDKHKDAVYDPNQLFLPDTTLVDSEQNVSFLTDVVNRHEIKVVINQSAFSLDILSLLSACRDCAGVKIVSCYHNSILTPVYNYAYQMEYRLRKRHLTVVFHLLRSPIMKWLVTGIYKRKYRKDYRCTINMSDAVVVLTEGLKRELKDMVGVKSLPSAHVIYNYMPNITTQPAAKENIVLWVGTFDYAVKRPDLMLDAWRIVQDSHPEWQLQMLGDGPSLNEMKDYANQIGAKRITFTGRVNPAHYYEKAKVSCMTSTHEAFSMVAVEAISHEASVIMFDSFTSAPILTDNGRCGMLVKPFDRKEYARCLSDLMDDAVLRKNINKIAQKNIEQFSPERVYADWEKLFKTLC